MNGQWLLQLIRQKTKVMVSDGIACHIFIQNEHWSRWIHSRTLGSWLQKKWWVYDRIPYQVKHRAGDWGITAENTEKSQKTDFNEDTTNESASVACSNVSCESYTLRKNEETCLDAFEMKGLRKILFLWVSWTAKKTNEWDRNKAGIKRELLDTVKARKLAYYGHTMSKQGSYLEKEIMPGARRRGRPCTVSMDNIKTWTGLPVEETVRMTKNRDKWRKYVHDVANPWIKNG